MRWEQTEFLLKGLYLGLLLTVAMQGPSWQQVAKVAGFALGGLVIALASAAYNKLREGYKVSGRALGFVLFLLLENPGMVYVGLVGGLALGAYTTLRTSPEGQDWQDIVPALGGAVLGVVLYQIRGHADRRYRFWASLTLVALVVGGAIYLQMKRPELFEGTTREMIGAILLLGLPGFYLLTFSSLVEESEVEIAAICAALGVGLWMLADSAFENPAVKSSVLAIPVILYLLYTRYILPGLRVFKHSLRGLSYAQVGQFRPALASLNRALQLNPNYTLAREQLWYVHRQMDVDQLKNDPETLSLINYELCLERVAWLLLLDKPKANEVAEAQRLLELVASQRPNLAPICDYWRAVALLHQRDIEGAATNLERLLGQTPKDSPARRQIAFSAWQLALTLHPQMRTKVGEPVLAQPGMRLDAIAAIERKLAQQPEDGPAWDLKRVLYAGLNEAEYHVGAQGAPGGTAPEFDHAYTQQLGLALIDNPNEWQRGCEYLRIAARGMPADATNLIIQIAKTHEKFGDVAGYWQNLRQAMLVGKAIGAANLKDDDRTALFGIVKLVGKHAQEEGRIDDALEAYKYYSTYDKAGLETYRTLADLFEKKGDVWMALHCTEHAMSWDSTDKDLVARKGRYYRSIAPAELVARWEQVGKWFDFDYCIEQCRMVLDRFSSDLEWLEWGEQVIDLALAARPKSIQARFFKARILRIRGEVAQAVALLEDIRQNKPEKISGDEEEPWYLTHRLLGDMYLDEKPDLAIPCFLEFKKYEKSGADTMFKLGRAYEAVGDLTRSARCYEMVTGYESHPLYYEARAGLDRVKRG